MSILNKTTEPRKIYAYKPHNVTAKALIAFTRNLYKTLAGNYGGHCTLNEVRIMNQVFWCHLDGQCCSVPALQKVTGIPLTTVSRIVTNLLSDGWLSEQQDPTDGRKRIISLGLRALKWAYDDIDEQVQWFDDFRERGLPK